MVSALLKTTERQRRVFADVQKLLGYFQDGVPELMSASIYDFWDVACDLFNHSLRQLFGRSAYDAYASWADMLRKFLEELSFQIAFPAYTFDEFVAMYGRDALEEFYDMWCLDSQEERESAVDHLSFCKISYSDEVLPMPLGKLLHRFQEPGGDWGSVGYIIPTGGRAEESEIERSIEIYFSMFPIDEGYAYGYGPSEISYIVLLLMDFEEVYRYAKERRKGGKHE